jgi:5-methylcytosine-specific restriction enzyme subunit McrC
MPELAGGPARLLRIARRAFGGVTREEYAPANVPDVVFTRLNAHWEEPYQLARLIVQRQALRDRTGAVLGAAFTVDMNHLFQRLVARLIGDETRRAGCDLQTEPRRYLAPGVPIQPDMVVRRDGRDLAVADAKYKTPDGAGGAAADHADLYQMLAYCVSLGLPAGLLVYAAPQPLVAHSVRRANVRLEAVGVDLLASPAAIERELRAAARHLIDQAPGRAGGPHRCILGLATAKRRP